MKDCIQFRYYEIWITIRQLQTSHLRISRFWGVFFLSSSTFLFITKTNLYSYDFPRDLASFIQRRVCVLSLLRRFLFSSTDLLFISKRQIFKAMLSQSHLASFIRQSVFVFSPRERVQHTFYKINYIYLHLSLILLFSF